LTEQASENKATHFDYHQRYPILGISFF